jgi:hypothetical protein
MSEIIKKIEARITGKKYAQELPRLLVADLQEQKPAHNPYLTEYFVGVKLGHTVKVSDDNPNQKGEAVYCIEQALTELIFGEFRSDLVKLKYQLYDRDFDLALRTVKEIEQRMFYDGK